MRSLEEPQVTNSCGFRVSICGESAIPRCTLWALGLAESTKSELRLLLLGNYNVLDMPATISEDNISALGNLLTLRDIVAVCPIC